MAANIATATAIAIAADNQRATATAIAIAADNQRATATATAIAVGSNATNIFITFSIAMDAKTATATAIAPTPMHYPTDELSPCKVWKLWSHTTTPPDITTSTSIHRHIIIEFSGCSRPHWLDIATSIHRGEPPDICQWRFFVTTLQGIAVLELCRRNGVQGAATRHEISGAGYYTPQRKRSRHTPPRAATGQSGCRPHTPTSIHQVIRMHTGQPPSLWYHRHIITPAHHHTPTSIHRAAALTGNTGHRVITAPILATPIPMSYYPARE